MRNRIARWLCSLANRIATDNVICNAEEGWTFKREWVAVPYTAINL